MPHAYTLILAVLGSVGCASLPPSAPTDVQANPLAYGVTAIMGGRYLQPEWGDADGWLWYGAEFFGVSARESGSGLGFEFGFRRTTSDESISTPEVSSRGTAFTELYVGGRSEIPRGIGRIVLSAGVSQLNVVTSRPHTMGALIPGEDDSTGGYVRVGYAIPLLRGTELSFDVRARIGTSVGPDFSDDLSTSYVGGDIGLSFRF